MMRKVGMRVLSRSALSLAEGLFAHSVDFGLWVTIYFASMGVPQPRTGQLWRAEQEADRFLTDINYEVIKNAIQTARKRGWMKNVKRGALPEITEEGKRRLYSILPVYDETRVWDGKMHLITYDVPESKSVDRKILRDFLKRLGCGLLQKSVWITPYNPIDTLRNLIEEHELRGNIIVSDMGKDGSIGEEDIRAMLVRVYKLEDLNERYKVWLRLIDELGEVDHLAILQYLAVLKDDPQLPFSLLPPWWKEDVVYKKVESIIDKVVKLKPIGQKLTI